MEELLVLSYFHTYVVQPINILTKAILQLHFKTLDTYVQDLSSELYTQKLFHRPLTIYHLLSRNSKSGDYLGCYH